MRGRRVVIESPLRGDLERNVLYADACMFDSIAGRGEAPYLGHLLYPRVLDDERTTDRNAGITAHIAWIDAAELLAVYTDLGISSGMVKAIEYARTTGIAIEHRALGAGWRDRFILASRRTSGFW
jgi:hypothetical protein